MEPPEQPPPDPNSGDPKILKRMKKKLDELNRKIRHSRKKHDGMIHKQNSLRKVIEARKGGTKPELLPEPEWNFKECELAFNSRMTDVHQESDLEQIVDGMIAHIMTQIENPALLNSRFRFNEVIFLDINFHRLNLTRGSSYIPLSDRLARKKAIINPQNNDEECFKWAVITALEWSNIKFNPEHISNLRKFADNYDWSGLKFPVSTKDIGGFEIRNNVSINVLAVEGREIYIHRKG